MQLPERLRKPGYKYLAALVGLGIVASAPVWGRRVLHRLTYFHVRSVEIRGVRYLQPADVVARLRVDTLRSLFDDVTPLEARLRTHPQVAAVRITRRPPGTLVVQITENLPVALVPSGDGLQPYDSAGKPLPIDPSRTALDLPILRTPDPQILNLLGALRQRLPALFGRISQVERGDSDDVTFVLDPALRVRAALGVAPDRLRDIFPVASDLTRRHERATELDLRYRGQVIAKL